MALGPEILPTKCSHVPMVYAPKVSPNFAVAALCGFVSAAVLCHIMPFM